MRTYLVFNEYRLKRSNSFYPENQSTISMPWILMIFLFIPLFSSLLCHISEIEYMFCIHRWSQVQSLEFLSKTEKEQFKTPKSCHPYRARRTNGQQYVDVHIWEATSKTRLSTKVCNATLLIRIEKGGIKTCRKCIYPRS